MHNQMIARITDVEMLMTIKAYTEGLLNRRDLSPSVRLQYQSALTQIEQHIEDLIAIQTPTEPHG
jgi:hypothetical protein